MARGCMLAIWSKGNQLKQETGPKQGGGESKNTRPDPYDNQKNEKNKIK